MNSGSELPASDLSGHTRLMPLKLTTVRHVIVMNVGRSTGHLCHLPLEPWQRGRPSESFETLSRSASEVSKALRGEKGKENTVHATCGRGAAACTLQFYAEDDVRPHATARSGDGGPPRSARCATIERAHGRILDTARAPRRCPRPPRCAAW
eukprot:3158884-Prymnesium_polylepis.2